MTRKSRPIALCALPLCALGLLCGLGVPAYAQMAGGGLNPANPIGATPRLHHGSRGDESPPPALPGGSGIDTNSQSQVQIDNENPTTVLFTAINHNNYAEARAAISRGANLNARNALGETPIEMSVALNHNNITFMLLSMRAADGGGGAVAAPAPIPVMTTNGPAGFHARPKPQAPAVRQMHVSQPVPAGQPGGVPNPSAGFLGFNGAS
jgi:hypothetical protein